MTGTVNGTIGGTGAALVGRVGSAAAAALTFTGTADGIHGGGTVNGNFSGSTSNGGTFSGSFTGPVDGSALTYTASGTITFSGSVTGAVPVAISGNCPQGQEEPGPVASLAILGSSPSVGQTSQFRAIATMTTGATQDVTGSPNTQWFLNPTFNPANGLPVPASVSSSGLVTGLNVGKAQLGAQYVVDMGSNGKQTVSGFLSIAITK